MKKEITVFVMSKEKKKNKKKRIRRRQRKTPPSYIEQRKNTPENTEHIVLKSTEMNRCEKTY
jgi:hypothetical protein